MITRKLGSLTAALGVAALVFSHVALGQSSQPNPAPAGSASSEQTTAGTP